MNSENTKVPEEEFHNYGIDMDSVEKIIPQYRPFFRKKPCTQLQYRGKGVKRRTNAPYEQVCAKAANYLADEGRTLLYGEVKDAVEAFFTEMVVEIFTGKYGVVQIDNIGKFGLYIRKPRKNYNKNMQRMEFLPWRCELKFEPSRKLKDYMRKYSWRLLDQHVPNHPDFEEAEARFMEFMQEQGKTEKQVMKIRRYKSTVRGSRK